MFLVTRCEQVASQASPRDQQCDVWGLDGVSRRRLKVLNTGLDLLRRKPLVLASSVYLLGQVRTTSDMSAASLLEGREKRQIKAIKNPLKISRSSRGTPTRAVGLQRGLSRWRCGMSNTVPDFPPSPGNGDCCLSKIRGACGWEGGAGRGVRYMCVCGRGGVGGHYLPRLMQQ